jgi:IS5 family transposase
MKQVTFSDAEFSGKKRVTRRERLLMEMDRRVPWSLLVAEIDPFYPKGGGRGRPPLGVERMLRMYVIQQILGLSDEGAEDAVYDSQSVRAFVGVDLGRESVPDAKTLLKFRRLRERNGLTKRMFEVINAHLAEQGLLLRQGTVVDATLIAAAPSTKNREKRRDPEMKQTKKGNQWYFGLKAHVGADAAIGLVHSLAVSAANEPDVSHVHELLHGDERLVLADAGYTGAEKRDEVQHLEGVTWCIAAKRGRIKQIPQWSPLRAAAEAMEKAKASARAPVEHVFQVMKCRFGYRKARYRGLAKNKAQLFSLLGLGNLIPAGRWASPA